MSRKDFIPIQVPKRNQTLFDVIPDIVKYWDKELNGGLEPKDFKPSEGRRIYMSCPDCGVQMDRVVRNCWAKDANGDTYVTPCHKCANKRSGKKKAVLAINACPEVKDWWVPEKNAGIELDGLSVASHDMVNLVCPKCGDERRREMYRFAEKQTDGSYKISVCQKCTPTAPAKKVSLKNAVPDIEKYWDFEKNEGIILDNLGASSSVKVWTKCPICNTSVLRNVRYTWEKDANGVGHVIHCRTCGKRSNENALVSLCPDIKQYWNYEKNEHTPEYYSISSGQYVHMQCPICNRDVNRAICDSVYKEKEGRYRVVVCRRCAMENALRTRRNGNTNIVKACPDIDKYWDYERNTVRPNEITVFSREKIHTSCPSCSKKLERIAINSFVRNGDKFNVKKCQICGAKDAIQKQALDKSGSLLSACPEIEQWWDYDRNDLAPDQISRGSRNIVFFKCPQCGDLKNACIKSFVTLHSDGKYRPVECSECGYSTKGNPIDNLVAVCPEVINWWNYEKNEPFVPEEFSKGSQFEAYLTCPECGMELHTGIHTMFYTDEEGRVRLSHEGKCRKLKAQVSINNLVTNYPEIKKWWDYEKNSPNLPEDYTTGSRLKVYFRCPECGIGTYSRISDAFKTDEDGVPDLFRCSFCAGTRPIPGVNSLAALYPEIAKECISVSDTERILPTALSRVEWQGSNCGHTWFDIVANRVNGAGCPYCEGRSVLKGFNDLATTNPELAKEWSDRNNRKSDEVMKKWIISSYWVCPECKGEYTHHLSRREFGDEACPYCYGRSVLKGFNDLVTTNPDLAKEWSPNNIRGAETVRRESSLSALWICPTCNGEYSYAVNERELEDNACPYCLNKKALKGYNTLKVKHPELMKEWLEIENAIVGIDPDAVLDSDTKEAWWGCPICDYKYTLKIKKRVLKEKRHHNPCPKCNGRRQVRHHFI